MNEETEERCACGQPLHYRDRAMAAIMEKYVRDNGPLVKITTEAGKAWMVPRHYVALHGIAAAELPALAVKYNFKEVPPIEPKEGNAA